MKIDIFKESSPSMVDPISEVIEVTPSNTEELEWEGTCITCDTGGTVAVVLSSGQETTLTLDAGAYPYPYRIRQVKATGTTALGIKVWRP